MSKYEIIIYWSEEDKVFITNFLNFRVIWRTAKLFKRRWRMRKLLFGNGLKRRGIWADKFPNRKEDRFLHNGINNLQNT